MTNENIKKKTKKARLDDLKRAAKKEKIAAAFSIYKSTNGNVSKTSELSGLSYGTVRSYSIQHKWSEKLEKAEEAKGEELIIQSKALAESKIEGIKILTTEFQVAMKDVLTDFLTTKKGNFTSDDLSQLHAISKDLYQMSEGIIPGQKHNGTFIQNNNISGIKDPNNANNQIQQSTNNIVGDGHTIDSDLSLDWMKLVVSKREKQLEAKREEHKQNREKRKQEMLNITEEVIELKGEQTNEKSSSEQNQTIDLRS